MDNLSEKQRSYCMSRVKGKDTGLERVVRSALHKRGYRFRKHVKGLPGKPDIVFVKARLVVFLDGDFWHGYRFPQWEKTLAKFWRKKIGETRKRDQRNFAKLRRMGWRVLRIWEHSIERDLDGVIRKICAEHRASRSQQIR
ncbi:MAG: very short patch repair endonuclease [Planctomycetes bacterium B3_Pla]|nr:MAG: very short patch repair endonuclease [Planctomycetes bacterium B3_Pla]